METRKILVALGLVLGLSACAGSEPASRSLGVESLTIASQGGPLPQSLILPEAAPLPSGAGYAVTAVTINVPRSLKVSEANTFKPRADIVWHGDPDGDRYAQVGAILTTAAQEATAGMDAGRPVTVDVTLVKFHALTEKTRKTFGGMHDLRFDLTVRDAMTGEVLDGPRLVNADIKAAGGSRARAEEAAGLTQKVVVTERLRQVLRRELSAPLPATVALAMVTPAPQGLLPVRQ